MQLPIASVRGSYTTPGRPALDPAAQAYTYMNDRIPADSYAALHLKVPLPFITACCLKHFSPHSRFQTLKILSWTAQRQYSSHQIQPVSGPRLSNHRGQRPLDLTREGVSVWESALLRPSTGAEDEIALARFLSNQLRAPLSLTRAASQVSSKPSTCRSSYREAFNDASLPGMLWRSCQTPLSLRSASSSVPKGGSLSMGERITITISV